MPKQVRRRKGERKPRPGFDAKKGHLELMTGLRGSTPLKHARYMHLERTIGKNLEKPIVNQNLVGTNQTRTFTRLTGKLVRVIAKNHLESHKIIIPKEVEHVPIGLALKRAFRSMAGTGYFMDRKTKKGIRQVISQLHKNGKISFNVVEVQEKAVVKPGENAGKKRRLPIRALKKAKKKKLAAEALRNKVPKFKIEASANLAEVTKQINSLISRERGAEFRHFFRKYLLEEAEHTHWYLTEKIERLVMSESERVNSHN